MAKVSYAMTILGENNQSSMASGEMTIGSYDKVAWRFEGAAARTFDLSPDDATEIAVLVISANPPTAEIAYTLSDGKTTTPEMNLAVPHMLLGGGIASLGLVPKKITLKKAKGGDPKSTAVVEVMIGRSAPRPKAAKPAPPAKAPAGAPAAAAAPAAAPKKPSP